MKKIIFAIIILQGVLSAQGLVTIDRSELENRLEVRGTAKILAQADQASFSFTVVEYGSTLREAYKKASVKIEKLSEKLFNAGLKKNNLETIKFDSGENAGDKAFLSDSRDFAASIKTIVNTDSLELLEELVFLVSESDVNSVSDIRFSIKEIEKFREEALRKAVEKAKEKGRIMAESLNVLLGSAIIVREEHFSPAVPLNYLKAEVRGGASGGSLFSAEAEVQSSVYVVFRINSN